MGVFIWKNGVWLNCKNEEIILCSFLGTRDRYKPKAKDTSDNARVDYVNNLTKNSKKETYNTYFK